MGLAKPTTSNPVHGPANLSGGNGAQFSDQLLEKARADTDTVLKELGSQLDGLSEVEAASRSKRYGLNDIAREKRQSALMRLLDNVKNPLVILLTALGVLSFLTGDLRAMVVIFMMALLGGVLHAGPIGLPGVDVHFRDSAIQTVGAAADAKCDTGRRDRAAPRP